MANPLLRPLSANRTDCIAALLLWLWKLRFWISGKERFMSMWNRDPELLFPWEAMGKPGGSISIQGSQTATLSTQPCSYPLGQILTWVGSHLCQVEGTPSSAGTGGRYCPPGHGSAFILPGFAGSHCPSGSRRSTLQRWVLVKYLLPTCSCWRFLKLIIWWW